MLPTNQLELITAAVDGELSAEDARAFWQLLNSSPEARALYAKLQADSLRIRALPPVAPPADLCAKILEHIATAVPPAKPASPLPQAHPAQPAAVRPWRSRVAAWAPLAVAASLLVCVAAASFAYFSQNGDRGEVANSQWLNSLPAPRSAAPALPSAGTSPPPNVPAPDPSNIAKSEVAPIPMPKEVQPQAVAVAPEPRPAVPPDLLAHQVWPKLPPFELVQVRLPFLRGVSELDRDDVRQELLEELGRDPAFRIDVFVRDVTHGVTVFQNAGKASGVTLFADATTLARLKKKQVASVAIYTESLSAAELTDFFTKLAAEDTKFTPRVCDTLHATPVSRTDELDLKAVLGIDAGLYKRATGTGTGQGTDKSDDSSEPKSVSDGTIDSVAKSLTKGGPKAPAKTAVLLAWQPNAARTFPSISNELKQYLAKRGNRKPNAVPVIIVIRPVG